MPHTETEAEMRSASTQAQIWLAERGAILNYSCAVVFGEEEKARRFDGYFMVRESLKARGQSQKQPQDDFNLELACCG